MKEKTALNAEADSLRCLVAWIGRQDLDGASQKPCTGPVVDFLRGHPDIRCFLLSDWPKEQVASYLSCVERTVNSVIEIRRVKLADPTDYLAVYKSADSLMSEVTERFPLDEIAVHTSPGTSTMAAVWVLLSKTKFEGVRLFKSWIDKTSGTSREAEVDIPFKLSLEVLPELAARRAQLLEVGDRASFPITNAFDAIVHRSAATAGIIRDARKMAMFPNPVLILGESGTGKELIARAIHAASPRSSRPWGAMNCAAIPRELLDSELFGHIRGAYTGAVTDRQGRFEACNGGTLFLDEVGDMPPETQVRLLRVLQEGEIQRVGDPKVKKVDVRVVAATNRDLISEVNSGGFRDDLFYRLAVLILRIPPLRERRDDIAPLADHFLAELNERARSIPGVGRKVFSSNAKRFAQAYSWPGNVRELQNTLARAFAMVSGDTLTAEDLEAQIIPTGVASISQPLLKREKNFSLDAQLGAIERNLIEQALRETGGIKERAAKLLGLGSRQALSHRMRRLRLGT